MTHYIAMSGSAGCMPEWISACDTIREAVDAVVEMWGDEYGPGLRRHIAQFRCASLPHGAGADYIEIVSCDCADPSIHAESE